MTDGGGNGKALAFTGVGSITEHDISKMHLRQMSIERDLGALLAEVRSVKEDIRSARMTWSAEVSRLSSAVHEAVVEIKDMVQSLKPKRKKG